MCDCDQDIRALWAEIQELQDKVKTLEQYFECETIDCQDFCEKGYKFCERHIGECKASVWYYCGKIEEQCHAPVVPPGDGNYCQQHLSLSLSQLGAEM